MQNTQQTPHSSNGKVGSEARPKTTNKLWPVAVKRIWNGYGNVRILRKYGVDKWWFALSLLSSFPRTQKWQNVCSTQQLTLCIISCEFLGKSKTDQFNMMKNTQRHSLSQSVWFSLSAGISWSLVVLKLRNAEEKRGDADGNETKF